MKVFIADDNVMVCDRLTTMLKQIGGVEVVGQAHDVLEAIHSIEEISPDLVILDLQMPSGTGFDVLSRIKQDNLSPKIIMLTNYPFPQYRKRSIEAGADYFFDKSTEFEKISGVVNSFMTS